MTQDIYHFNSEIYSSEICMEQAHVVFPPDTPKELLQGKEKLRVLLDGFSCEGSVGILASVTEESTASYILGIREEVRRKVRKDIGDRVAVSVVKETRKIYRVL